MSKPSDNVKVSIMQREFTVACTAAESQSVVEAAAYLDRQMRSVSGGAKVLGIDRCAIMAGLNISHELLASQESATTGKKDNAQMQSRLVEINRRVDDVVTDLRKVAASS